jgi:hypothetical protein
MSPSTLVINGRLPGVPACLALVANRAYRIEPGRRASALPEAVPVRTEPLYAVSSNEHAERRLVEEAHPTAMGKPLTDVLVRGSARALRGATAVLETGVRVGAARKAVRVVGDRRILVGADGALSFSSPEPFVEMPLVWDRAYGGRDRRAEQLFASREPRERFGGPGEADLWRLAKVLYPRNGAGRGYYLDQERGRLDGAAAPNLEDPTDPVTPDRLLSTTTTDWIDRPVAACYEPIDVFTFPRAAFLVRPAFDPPSRPVHELGTGAVFPEDLTKKFDLRTLGDRRVLNSAPSGLAVCRLDGRERVSLWNLHARHELLEFDLPDDRPRLVIEPPGVGALDLEPLLQTVLIEPDEDRVTLTWAGVLPVAMPYPEEMTTSMRHVAAWSREPALGRAHEGGRG